MKHVYVNQQAFKTEVEHTKLRKILKLLGLTDHDVVREARSIILVRKSGKKRC